MREIDSTETTQTQVEQENNAEKASLIVTSRPSTLRQRIFIILSLLSLYFLWGGTYLAMRIALHGFPPFILAGVRQLTAGIILFLVLWLRKHELPTRKQWLTAIVVGGLLLVVGNGGVVFAEQWVSSGLAALALGAIPLWTALFSGLFGRWPTRIEWFGLGLGFYWIGTLKPGKWIACKSFGRNCIVHRTDRLGVWFYIEPASSQSKGLDGERISNACRWRFVVYRRFWHWRAHDQHAWSWASGGDGLSNHWRLSYCFQRIWLSPEPCEASASDQLRLCQSISCRGSGSSACGRTNHYDRTARNAYDFVRCGAGIVGA